MGYFGELYYKAFHVKLEQRSEVEAKRVLELLQPSSILDAGCGWGRHLRHFIAWGLDAYGIEPEPYFVQVFKSNYPQWSERIILGRMQDVPPFRTFDGVVSLWTSVGWDEDEDDIFERFNQFLAPNGRLLVDIDNLKGWRAHFCRRWWEKVGGGIVLDQHQLKGNRLISRREFILGDERHIVERRLKLFSLDDLRNVAGRHGLHLLEVYSSLDGHPFYPDAPRICAVFHKAT